MALACPKDQSQYCEETQNVRVNGSQIPEIGHRQAELKENVAVGQHLGTKIEDFSSGDHLDRL